MPSKLKKRRQRRLKADAAWWRAEAGDLHGRVMEQADIMAEQANELADLQRQLAIERAVAADKTTSQWQQAARCEVCVEGARGGCSTCAFNRQ
ncbi:hypothetical protein [Cronobacter sakazakii]|uniref:hypothetical protein n=1 Tax=Cronobacter sakazakii TaxID=28141 RepID=UPI001F50FDA7|nr:hypothetical protein [Cronobacter sakazakii]MCI0287320.1 hypothetical protein [Cronobacter sakazakii]MDI7608788.1 hypothetical protein [Cronobacter sakazakii]MDI7614359.1 hypothetical protein [Cronobacter sakazakii]